MPHVKAQFTLNILVSLNSFMFTHIHRASENFQNVGIYNPFYSFRVI